MIQFEYDKKIFTTIVADATDDLYMVINPEVSKTITMTEIFLTFYAIRDATNNNDRDTHLCQVHFSHVDMAIWGSESLGDTLDEARRRLDHADKEPDWNTIRTHEQCMDIARQYGEDIYPKANTLSRSLTSMIE